MERRDNIQQGEEEKAKEEKRNAKLKMSKLPGNSSRGLFTCKKTPVGGFHLHTCVCI